MQLCLREPKWTCSCFMGLQDITIQIRPINVEKEITPTGCIESKQHKKTPSLFNSMIPEDAGQLIAYIHQMIVINAVNKTLKGEDCTYIDGMELFVIRSGKCIFYKVKLSAEYLSINACTFCSFKSPTSALCK